MVNLEDFFLKFDRERDENDLGDEYLDSPTTF